MRRSEDWHQQWGSAWGDYGANCSNWQIDPSSHHFQNPRTLSEKIERMRFAVGGNRKTGYEEPIPTTKAEAIAVLEHARRQASLDGPQGAMNFFNDSQSQLFSQMDENNILDILERSLTIYARGFEECGVEPSVFAAGYLQGKVEALGGQGIPQLRINVWGREEEAQPAKAAPPATPGAPGAAGEGRSAAEVIRQEELARLKAQREAERARWWAANKTKVFIGIGVFVLLLGVGGAAAKKRSKRARRQSPADELMGYLT